jgi:hypothetical protein
VTEIELDVFGDPIPPPNPRADEYMRAVRSGEYTPAARPPVHSGAPRSISSTGDQPRQFRAAATSLAATATPATSQRYPTFDIDQVLPNRDNFLRAYYDEGIKEDTPNEFHLWCALAVLSLAAGRRVMLKDDTPITCNLAICLTGATTVGKSRALAHAVRMVRRSMRWSSSDPSTGVRLVDNPGSGEFLVKSLVNELENPTDPKKPSGVFTPVKALIRFEELSIFVSKSGTQAGILQQMVMGLANGDDYIGRGSLSNGSDAAEDAFATLVSTTQTKSLQHLFGDRDRVSGLLNRFIFVQGTPKRKRSRGGSPLDFTAAETHLKRVRSWVALEERMIDYDEDAGPEWDRFFYERVMPAMEADTSELMSRMNLMLMRLLVLFAINDCSDTIKVSHVRSAEALFEYLLGCYRAVDSGLGMAEEDAIRHRLLEQVSKLEETTGAPAIQGQLLDRVKTKAYPKSQMEAFLRKMQIEGLLSVKPHQGKRGPATHTWSLTEAGRDLLDGFV